MTRSIPRTALSAACTAAIVGLPSVGMASGFAVPEISIAGLGLSNALVANTDEVGAIAYNPAIAALQSGHSVSGGLMLVAPSLEVTTATGTHQSQGEDVIPIPMGQLAYQWNKQAALTLGITAPFGLETVWDASAPGVFPGLVGGGHPTKSKVQLIDVNPALAFKLNNQLAIAIGADLYWAKEVVFNADVITNNGDGTGWGWNAAMVYDNGPWSAGVAYHSAATVDVQGDAFFVPTSASSPAQADLPVPSRLQAGVRYRASKQLAVEFDITRTGWSDFGVLVINNSLPSPPAPSPVTSANNWKDVNAYRFGASYQWNSKTLLRAGYTYDETPQPRDYFSARIPDNDRHLFSIGLSHEMGNGLAVDAGYMYVIFKDYTHAVAGAGPVPGDPNGSVAYNGDYESSVHLFGVGVTKRF